MNGSTVMDQVKYVVHLLLAYIRQLVYLMEWIYRLQSIVYVAM